MKRIVRLTCTTVCAHAVLFPALAVADLAELVRRAESTPRKMGDGLKEPRVARNAKGDVVDLNLDYLQLRTADFDDLVKCKTLNRLSLMSTNVTDDQLKQLIGSERLRWLRLNHTAIGDTGLKHLAKIKSLKSLCLGGVDVSAEAVKQLRKERPDMKIGYYSNMPR